MNYSLEFEFLQLSEKFYDVPKTFIDLIFLRIYVYAYIALPTEHLLSEPSCLC
jgi:hypothetical protein